MLEVIQLGSKAICKGRVVNARDPAREHDVEDC